ncbi:MAG: flagellar hook-basal body complex protein FliE [Hydrogenophilaceae bacterium]
MVNPGIEQMVNQLRAVASQASGPDSSAQSAASGHDFSAMLQAAVAEVNNTQMDAKQLSEQFAQGDGTNLQDVVVSLQKASLSFQAMVQVRNKLVSAYQEVMNMQV